MNLTKDIVKDRRYLRFNGSSYTAVIADKDEDEIFKAYIEFAYYHTINDAEMYEKAVLICRLKEQKTLFSQLACRKREVLNKLKMNRTNFTIALTPPGEIGLGSLNRYLPDMDTIHFFTLEDAFDFAYRRENKTLGLYNKLQKTTHYSMSKLLFDYLIEAQSNLIQYLDAQLSATNGGSYDPVQAGSQLEAVSGMNKLL